MLQVLSENTLEPITVSNDSVFEHPGRPALSNWGRKRASAACRVCRERKVRCDLTTKGPPCSNCIHDEVVCTVIESKRRKSSSGANEPLSPTFKGVKRKSASMSAPVVIKEDREYDDTLQSQHSALQSQHSALQSQQYDFPFNPSFSKTEAKPEPQTPREEVKTRSLPPGADSTRRYSEHGTYLSPTESVASSSYAAVRDTYPKSTKKPSILEVEMADALTSLRSWSGTADNETSSSSRRSDRPNNDSDSDSKEETSALVYTGDASAYTFVTMIFQDVEGHGWIPSKAAAQSLPDIDIEFLRSKGAFILPGEELMNELLGCYFEFSHPFIPVVEERQIRKVLHEEGTGGVPLLLLQSMFFTASSFARRDILERGGFKNRREMKRTFYDRAKILCDLDYEQNKLIVISSTLLLSHYFYHPSYRYNNWFWSNYALGICQTLGFHREPSPKVAATLAERRLWKRIWWTCFARAVFIAFGMGQPISINMDDCDVSLPEVSELIEPFDQDGEIWAALFLWYIKYSLELAKILNGLYSGSGSKKWKLAEIRECDARLTNWYHGLDSWRTATSLDEVYCRSTKKFALFNGYLEAYYSTASIILYRPVLFESNRHSEEGLKSPIDTQTQNQQRVQEEAKQRISDAAASMDATIERLISFSLAECFNTQMISCMIPSMAIHLYESVAAAPLLKRIARHKIELYLIVMRELQDAYPSAEFGIRFFVWALEKVDREQEAQKYKKRKTKPAAPSFPPCERENQQNPLEQTPAAGTIPMMRDPEYGMDTSGNITMLQTDEGFGTWPNVVPNNFHVYDEMWLGMLLGADNGGGIGNMDEVDGGRAG